MSSKIFTNINILINTREHAKLLRGADLAQLPSVSNAYIVIEDNIIAEYGSMNSYRYNPNDCISVNEGTVVMPCWCDSHTHLVFAGSREHEFVDKINGVSYADIAAKGGGILHSAKKVNEASEDELFNSAWQRLEEIKSMGTGAVEIKSGYGLTVMHELKMLRVIKKLKEKSNCTIRATFLGAHAYPLEYKQDHKKYIDSIINEMLPVIAEEKLADYIDVFCENGFFSAEETEVICKAALEKGLQPKLHVNQLTSVGGIEAGISDECIVFRSFGNAE